MTKTTNKILEMIPHYYHKKCEEPWKRLKELGIMFEEGNHPGCLVDHNKKIVLSLMNLSSLFYDDYVEQGYQPKYPLYILYLSLEEVKLIQEKPFVQFEKYIETHEDIEKNLYDITVLSILSNMESIKKVKYLAERFGDKHLFNPLLCCLYCDADYVLKTSDFIDYTQKDMANQNAMFYAIRNKDIQVLDVLAELGVDLNWISINGESPLGIAMRYEYFDVFCRLLELGADPTLENKSGISVMNLALYSDNIKYLNAILRITGKEVTRINNVFALYMMAHKANYMSMKIWERLVELYNEKISKEDTESLEFVVILMVLSKMSLYMSVSSEYKWKFIEELIEKEKLFQSYQGEFMEMTFEHIIPYAGFTVFYSEYFPLSYMREYTNSQYIEYLNRVLFKYHLDSKNLIKAKYYLAKTHISKEFNIDDEITEFQVEIYLQSVIEKLTEKSFDQLDFNSLKSIDIFSPKFDQLVDFNYRELVEFFRGFWIDIVHYYLLSERFDEALLLCKIVNFCTKEKTFYYDLVQEIEYAKIENNKLPRIDENEILNRINVEYKIQTNSLASISLSSLLTGFIVYEFLENNSHEYLDYSSAIICWCKSIENELKERTELYIKECDDETVKRYINKSEREHFTLGTIPFYLYIVKRNNQYVFRDEARVVKFYEYFKSKGVFNNISLEEFKDLFTSIKYVTDKYRNDSVAHSGRVDAEKAKRCHEYIFHIKQIFYYLTK